MDFSTVKNITIPEGSVSKITDSQGTVLWQKAPTLYREVAFIDSTACLGWQDPGLFGIRLQWNDTWDTPVIKTKVWLTRKEFQYYGGLISGQDANKLILYCDNWNGLLGCKWGNSNYTYWGDFDNYSSKEIEIQYDTTRGEVIIDEDTRHLTGTTIVGNICLFCQTYNLDEPSMYGLMYYFKVYSRNDPSILYYDLVPAERKSDNVVGLYDKVAHRFYPNEGTNYFDRGYIVEENPEWSE